jgi:hypothetical protein
MFIIQTTAAHRLRKFSILFGAIYLLFGAFGALFTMHVYMKPKPRPPEKGFRVFGFRLS